MQLPAVQLTHTWVGEESHWIKAIFRSFLWAILLSYAYYFTACITEPPSRLALYHTTSHCMSSWRFHLTSWSYDFHVEGCSRMLQTSHTPVQVSLKWALCTKGGLGALHILNRSSYLPLYFHPLQTVSFTTSLPSCLLLHCQRKSHHFSNFQHQFSSE